MSSSLDQLVIGRASVKLRSMQGPGIGIMDYRLSVGNEEDYWTPIDFRVIAGKGR